MDELGGDLAKVSYLERRMADGYSQVEFSNTLYVRPTFLKKSTCPLCNGKPQTLDHHLISCMTVLENGKYTWRHNRILEELVRFIKNNMKSEPIISTQKFISERDRIYDSSNVEIIVRNW